MLSLIRREIHILLHHPIYMICMVILPLFTMLFFTSVMSEGQPLDMPIGIVDLDNSSTTRKLTRMIDSFQSSRVVAHYASMEEARHAMQKNEIYGFLLFPEKMTQDLLSARQPKMSFYYTNTSLTAGALIFKEMKTLCTLGSAAVGKATMQAKGYTNEQIQAFLQPIALDTHNVGNPWVNYNIYLSTMLVPAILMLFIFLVTIYSLGTEIKFNTHKEWIETAGGDFGLALFCKLCVHTCIWIVVTYIITFYMFGVLHFPAPGGFWRLAMLGVLTVLAAQGFAVFLFGLIPSLRMALSIGALWSVLSFSMVGSAFPIFAMDAPLHTLAWLFPLRHYYLVYQLCIFNDYPLHDVIPNIIALLCFAFLPILIIKKMKKAFLEFGYQP